MLLLSLLPLFLHADIVNQVFVDPSFSGGTGPCDSSLSAPTGRISQTCAATGGDGAVGKASNYVDYGVIKMSGSTQSGQLNTVTRGIFNDFYTVNVQGQPLGTPGTLTYEIILSGSLDVGTVGSKASWLLQTVAGGGAFDITKGGSVESPDLGPGSTGDPLTTYFVTGHFAVGVAVPLDVELTGSAQSINTFSGPGSASYDLAHSLYWGGITNVSIGGVPVSSFNITSASGTDWTKSFAPASTPEPSSLLLLGSGLLGMGSLARRGRKSGAQVNGSRRREP